ncbi:hypothetical protein MNBD_GAMMA23-1437 [hydrothermal vent metagenome]|uniref:Spermatogenesis-associated protein 20-like TRX domain-containing protein n=1 Tax=hydrothermal vent metagenome TaxID=652676 RepID=A0A3B0ZCV3_9ZZZZ
MVVYFKMLKITYLFVVLFMWAGFNIASAGVKETALPPYSTHYDPARDPFADGRAAIALAKASQRRILIEVGGDWCKWCHLLDKFIKSDKHIEQALHQTFVVLKVNVSDENSNEKFLSTFPKNLGYPHMYVANMDGKVIHSQDTGAFLSNLKYSKQKFLMFLEKWKLKSLINER